MSDLPNVDETVKATIEVFASISQNKKELGRLQAKSAKQAGDITKLIADKARLSAEYDSLRGDARLKIRDLEYKVAEFGASFSKVKKERDEANEQAAKDAELNKKLIRAQDANDTLARNNAHLREHFESLLKTNRKSSQYNAELHQRLNQAEDAVRDALESITGDDNDGELPS